MNKLCKRCGTPIDRANQNYRKMIYCSLPCFKETLRKAPATILAEKVRKAGPEECWPWTGRKDKSGYGRIARKGPYVYAHRVAWILAKGPVPEGKDILHRCDNRACCNPAHYFLGDQATNNRDMWAKGRGKTKLNPEAVREIRAAFAALGDPKKVPDGFNQRLAEKYGVLDKTIWEVRRGINWSRIK